MPVQYRPELHVTAETGVLNAPAGVLRDGNSWHVFYQFQPKVGAPQRWGHVISEDGPFDWEECDDVLAPAGGETHLRAGSVIADGGGADLYFTSVTAAGTSVQLAHMKLLEDSCEVSDDPTTLDATVNRVAKVVDDQSGFRDFRSPCVVRNWSSDADRDRGHDGWVMLAVSGDMADPKLVILTSPDARDFTLIGQLLFDGDHGLDSTANIVAPRIIRLRDEVDGEIHDVLLLTLERDGVDHSGYMVGTLTGNTFAVKTPFTRLDHGYDFTRPRNTSFTPGTIPDDRVYDQGVIFGLLNGIGRQDDPSVHLSIRDSDWANVLSLPRVLTLQDGQIFQTPHPGTLDAVATSSRARSWVGSGEIPSGSSLTVDIKDADGRVAFRVVHDGDTLTVDRSMNEFHAGDAPMSVELREGDSDTLTVIVDGSTVEVFADGGQVAMASRAYIKGGGANFDVHTEGEAVIHRLLTSASPSGRADLLADVEGHEAYDEVPSED